MKGWTYGAEHELVDWPLDASLPNGSRHDRDDYTMVNSNGIANDPTGRSWKFGGEINTPATDSIDGQVNVLVDILRAIPEARANYRSNLHVHIRVPGLRENVVLLKRFQKFFHETAPLFLSVIDPIPDAAVEDKEARRRWRRRRVSHHTVLPAARLAKQLEAYTASEFFALEPPQSKTGKPLFHAQPRCAVSLRQLLQTDTIEFRHFGGTTDPEELRSALTWAHDFTGIAIFGSGQLFEIQRLLSVQKLDRFPSIAPFDHRLERGYRMTCHDGTLSRADIETNIQRVLSGDF